MPLEVSLGKCVAALNTKASKEYFGEVTIRLSANARAGVSRKEHSVYIFTVKCHSFSIHVSCVKREASLTFSRRGHKISIVVYRQRRGN